MSSIILFMIISFASTSIITQESVFKWLRKLIPFKPFTCPSCMSVWIGFLFSLIFPTLIHISISWLLYGLISYTTTRILQAWLSKYEFRIND